MDKSQAQENAVVGLDTQAGMTCKVGVKREALTVRGVWCYCSCAHKRYRVPLILTEHNKIFYLVLQIIIGKNWTFGLLDQRIF